VNVANRLLAIDSRYVKPRLTREQDVRPHGWSLLNVCQSLNETDSQETLQAASCFSQHDVLGQASTSLAQLFSTSALHIHLGCSSWRRFSLLYFLAPLLDCSQQSLNNIGV